MPNITTKSGFVLHYEDHYFGEPWIAPSVFLLIHGVAESGAAWPGWVAHLGRHYRVIRPDFPGFGRSPKPGAEFDYSPATLARVMAELLDGLAIPKVHVVGAKLGGSVAMQFAADHPEMTRSLTVASGPARAANTGGTISIRDAAADVRSGGVRTWAAQTQVMRLGTDASKEMLDYWTNLMAEADIESCIRITTAAAKLDLESVLPRIKAQTLVITTEKSPLQSVDAAGEYQRKIRCSELLIAPGDSYHVAVTQPDFCARHTLQFVARLN